MVGSRSETKRRRRDDSPNDANSKKTKVHAQRKFAQGAGGLNNSLSSTPVKERIEKNRTNGVANNGNCVAPVAKRALPARNSKNPTPSNFVTFLTFRSIGMLPCELDHLNKAPSPEPHLDCDADVKERDRGKVTDKSNRDAKRNGRQAVAKVSPPRKSVSAAQALKKKYHEQRLKKTTASSIISKAMPMARTTRSSGPIIEEISSRSKKPVGGKNGGTIKLLKKKNSIDIPPKKSVKSLSSSKQTTTSKTSVNIAPAVSIVSNRGGLRSSGNKPTGGLRSGARKIVPALIMLQKKKRQLVAAARNRVTSGGSKPKQPATSLSDFSSEDDLPLVKKNKPLVQAQKLLKKSIARFGNKRKTEPCNNQHSLSSPTLSGHRNTSPSHLTSNARPSRKTKEAAAFYLKILSPKRVIQDEDEMSVGSYLEPVSSKKCEPSGEEAKTRSSERRSLLSLAKEAGDGQKRSQSVPGRNSDSGKETVSSTKATPKVRKGYVLEPVRNLPDLDSEISDSKTRRGSRDMRDVSSDDKVLHSSGKNAPVKKVDAIKKTEASRKASSCLPSKNSGQPRTPISLKSSLEAKLSPVLRNVPDLRIPASIKRPLVAVGITNPMAVAAVSAVTVIPRNVTTPKFEKEKCKGGNMKSEIKDTADDPKEKNVDVKSRKSCQGDANSSRENSSKALDKKQKPILKSSSEDNDKAIALKGKQKTEKPVENKKLDVRKDEQLERERQENITASQKKIDDTSEEDKKLSTKHVKGPEKDMKKGGRIKEEDSSTEEEVKTVTRSMRRNTSKIISDEEPKSSFTARGIRKRFDTDDNDEETKPLKHLLTLNRSGSKVKSSDEEGDKKLFRSPCSRQLVRNVQSSDGEEECEDGDDMYNPPMPQYNKRVTRRVPSLEDESNDEVRDKKSQTQLRSRKKVGSSDSDVDVKAKRQMNIRCQSASSRKMQIIDNDDDGEDDDVSENKCSTRSSLRSTKIVPVKKAESHLTRAKKRCTSESEEDQVRSRTRSTIHKSDLSHREMGEDNQYSKQATPVKSQKTTKSKKRNEVLNNDESYTGSDENDSDVEVDVADDDDDKDFEIGDDEWVRGKRHLRKTQNRTSQRNKNRSTRAAAHFCNKAMKEVMDTESWLKELYHKSFEFELTSSDEEINTRNMSKSGSKAKSAAVRKTVSTNKKLKIEGTPPVKVKVSSNMKTKPKQISQKAEEKLNKSAKEVVSQSSDESDEEIDHKKLRGSSPRRNQPRRSRAKAQSEKTDDSASGNTSPDSSPGQTRRVLRQRKSFFSFAEDDAPSDSEEEVLAATKASLEMVKDQTPHTNSQLLSADAQKNATKNTKKLQTSKCSKVSDLEETQKEIQNHLTMVEENALKKGKSSQNRRKSEPLEEQLTKIDKKKVIAEALANFVAWKNEQEQSTSTENIVSVSSSVKTPENMNIQCSKSVIDMTSNKEGTGGVSVKHSLSKNSPKKGKSTQNRRKSESVEEQLAKIDLTKIDKKKVFAEALANFVAWKNQQEQSTSTEKNISVSSSVKTPVNTNVQCSKSVLDTTSKEESTGGVTVKPLPSENSPKKGKSAQNRRKSESVEEQLAKIDKKKVIAEALANFVAWKNEQEQSTSTEKSVSVSSAVKPPENKNVQCSKSVLDMTSKEESTGGVSVKHSLSKNSPKKGKSTQNRRKSESVEEQLAKIDKNKVIAEALANFAKRENQEEQSTSTEKNISVPSSVKPPENTNVQCSKSLFNMTSKVEGTDGVSLKPVRSENSPSTFATGTATPFMNEQHVTDVSEPTFIAESSSTVSGLSNSSTATFTLPRGSQPPSVCIPSSVASSSAFVPSVKHSQAVSSSSIPEISSSPFITTAPVIDSKSVMQACTNISPSFHSSGITSTLSSTSMLASSAPTIVSSPASVVTSIPAPVLRPILSSISTQMSSVPFSTSVTAQMSVPLPVPGATSTPLASQLSLGMPMSASIPGTVTLPQVSSATSSAPFLVPVAAPNITQMLAPTQMMIKKDPSNPSNIGGMPNPSTQHVMVGMNSVIMNNMSNSRTVFLSGSTVSAMATSSLPGIPMPSLVSLRLPDKPAGQQPILTSTPLFLPIALGNTGLMQAQGQGQPQIQTVAMAPNLTSNAAMSGNNKVMKGACQVLLTNKPPTGQPQSHFVLSVGEDGSHVLTQAPNGIILPAQDASTLVSMLQPMQQIKPAGQLTLTTAQPMTVTLNHGAPSGQPSTAHAITQSLAPKPGTSKLSHQILPAVSTPTSIQSMPSGTAMSSIIPGVGVTGTFPVTSSVTSSVGGSGVQFSQPSNIAGLPPTVTGLTGTINGSPAFIGGFPGMAASNVVGGTTYFTNFSNVSTCTTLNPTPIFSGNTISGNLCKPVTSVTSTSMSFPSNSTLNTPTGVVGTLSSISADVNIPIASVSQPTNSVSSVVVTESLSTVNTTTNSTLNTAKAKAAVTTVSSSQGSTWIVSSTVPNYSPSASTFSTTNSMSSRNVFTSSTPTIPSSSGTLSSWKTSIPSSVSSTMTSEKTVSGMDSNVTVVSSRQGMTTSASVVTSPRIPSAAAAMAALKKTSGAIAAPAPRVVAKTGSNRKPYSSASSYVAMKVPGQTSSVTVAETVLPKAITITSPSAVSSATIVNSSTTTAASNYIISLDASSHTGPPSLAKSQIIPVSKISEFTETGNKPNSELSSPMKAVHSTFTSSKVESKKCGGEVELASVHRTLSMLSTAFPGISKDRKRDSVKKADTLGGLEGTATNKPSEKCSLESLAEVATSLAERSVESPLPVDRRAPEHSLWANPAQILGRETIRMPGLPITTSVSSTPTTKNDFAKMKSGTALAETNAPLEPVCQIKNVVGPAGGDNRLSLVGNISASSKADATRLKVQEWLNEAPQDKEHKSKCSLMNSGNMCTCDSDHDDVSNLKSLADLCVNMERISSPVKVDENVTKMDSNTLSIIKDETHVQEKPSLQIPQPKEMVCLNSSPSKSPTAMSSQQMKVTWQTAFGVKSPKASKSTTPLLVKKKTPPVGTAKTPPTICERWGTLKNIRIRQGAESSGTDGERELYETSKTSDVFSSRILDGTATSLNQKEDSVSSSSVEDCPVERRALPRRAFLHRANERQEPKPVTEAFSADNECSVYAFEAETDCSPINQPFRRRSKTMSRSDEEDAVSASSSSTSVALQIATSTAKMPPRVVSAGHSATCGNDASAQMSCEEDDELYYIPIGKKADCLPTVGGGGEHIQGVTVKLDAEGPSGPNQRVTMCAKIVTKPPMFKRPSPSSSNEMQEEGPKQKRSTTNSKFDPSSVSRVGTVTPYPTEAGPSGTNVTNTPTSRAGTSSTVDSVEQNNSQGTDNSPVLTAEPVFSTSDVENPPSQLAVASNEGTVVPSSETNAEEARAQAQSEVTETSSEDQASSSNLERPPSADPSSQNRNRPSTSRNQRRSSQDSNASENPKSARRGSKSKPSSCRSSPSPSLPSTSSCSSGSCKPSTSKSSKTQASTNLESISEAPVFYPTEREFQDPIEYIEKIRPIAEKFGLCRIVPPPNFKPDCCVDDDMRFTAYNQYVHKMLDRWGPNAKEMRAIKKYVAQHNIELKQVPLVGGMELDLPRLFTTVQNTGGLMEVMEKKRWVRVADTMRIPRSAQDRATKLDQIYCQYVLPYDTLKTAERDNLFEMVEVEWDMRKERRNKRLANTSSAFSEDEEEEEESDGDDDDECIIKGRSMALSAFFRVARNTMSMWFKSAEPSPAEVETEYWRHVKDRNFHICVHSGSIDCSNANYGFPNRNSPFAKHPWNLKVLSNNSGSVLRSLGPLIGLTVPTLHVGMVFTTCCWYRDPHGLPWIEYLHTGANKIWYAIPEHAGEQFREAMMDVAPHYVRNQTVWLASDTAMVPPNMLTERHVALSRTVQEPGQFIVVFPRAYSSSICTGYLVSESVYFAPPHWLEIAAQSFKDMQVSCEPAMFSLERLLFAIAEDQRSSGTVLSEILSPLMSFLEKEVASRADVKRLGVDSSERMHRNTKYKKNFKGKNSNDEDEVMECEICRANLCVSLVTNTNDDTVYCLAHAVEYLKEDKLRASDCKLLYSYNQKELNEMLEKLLDGIEAKAQNDTKQNKGNSSKSRGMSSNSSDSGSSSSASNSRN